MRLKLGILMSGVLLTGLIWNTAYADDAQIACQKLGKNAVRNQPHFMNGQQAMDCSLLPSSAPNAWATCKRIANVAPPEKPNCSVNYYADTPADITLQCTPPASHGSHPKPVFKYVLCENNDKSHMYVWSPFSLDSDTNMGDKSGRLPNRILQKK